ncbi:MAG TPA: TrbI/VirB10 family protein [Rhodospirillales bacterium]|nr:TrbI/VirB10 family protein [Rhodospirillales bacterium]
MTSEDVAQAFEVRAAAPAPARISRKAVLIAVAALAAVLLFALFYGFHRSGRDEQEIPDREIPIQRPPDALAGIPSDYSQLPPPPQPALPQPPPQTAPGAAEARPGGPTPLGPQPPVSPPRPAPVDPEQQKVLQELDAARRSGLFVKTASGRTLKPAGAAATKGPGEAETPGSTRGLLNSGAREPSADPNLQGRKEGFLAASTTADVYVKKPYLDPVSPYEIKAGTIIPAALLTALNSDLPGDVFAQVTENVYDTATGRHLLVPQGAKLIGKYDSFVAFGQDRALVRWDRAIMPNGKSIQFGPMSAADQTGAAGLADGVDYHLGSAAIGIALSTAISLLGNLALDRGGGERTVLTDVGDTVSQESARVGSNITQRFLDIQPTIKIRAGWPLRVLVNKDIILAPYPGPAIRDQARN